jgi:hypothetical protein
MSGFGAAIGRGLAAMVDALGLGDAIRNHYAAKYGKCRVCGAPLGGESPEQICEPCHAGEILAKGFSDGAKADA